MLFAVAPWWHFLPFPTSPSSRLRCETAVLRESPRVPARWQATPDCERPVRWREVLITDEDCKLQREEAAVAAHRAETGRPVGCGRGMCAHESEARGTDSAVTRVPAACGPPRLARRVLFFVCFVLALLRAGGGWREPRPPPVPLHPWLNVVRV
mmetsp:Transcript_1225/g.3448  ORF Transcript_1225/g.3448 Transcript_1225/m.3448 type:complete len:154 (-) Transcript_1225:67-528(-)